MHVPQIGGQLGEFSFHVEPGTIPVDQGASRESMPHVMEPGTATVALGGCAEAQLLRQLGEGVARDPLGDPATPLGDEERRSDRCRKDAISGLGVLFQSVYRGGMKRYVTRFSKLRPPDVKDSALEVDIRAIQPKGLVDPHPCRYQQTEKSRIGVTRRDFCLLRESFFSDCV